MTFTTKGTKPPKHQISFRKFLKELTRENKSTFFFAFVFLEWNVDLKTTAFSTLK